MNLRELFKIVFLIVLILTGLWLISPFLDALVVAAAFAYIFYPIKERIRKKIGFSSLASFLVVLFIGAVIAAAILYIGFTLVSILPSAFEYLSQNLRTILETWRLERYLDVEGKLTSFLKVFAFDLGSLAKRTGVVLLKLFVFLFSMFYFLEDGQRLVDQFVSKTKKMIKDKERKLFTELLKDLDTVYRGLFVGYLLNGFVLALITWFQFWILGIEYPSLLALIAFVMGLLPFLDPWMFYVPISLWKIFVQSQVWFGLGILLLSFFTLDLFPMFFLLPQIAKRTAKVHPLIALVAFLGGPWVFGIEGLVIGPVVVGLIYSLFKIYLKHY